jgi:hypothetical protein
LVAHQFVDHPRRDSHPTVSAPLRTTAQGNHQAANRRRTPCNQPAAGDTQQH